MSAYFSGIETTLFLTPMFLKLSMPNSGTCDNPSDALTWALTELTGKIIKIKI